MKCGCVAMRDLLSRRLRFVVFRDLALTVCAPVALTSGTGVQRCRTTVWAAVVGVLIAFFVASPASAQLRGQNTPTLAKSFGAGSVSVGGSTTLTFVVTAANLGNSGVRFT